MRERYGYVYYNGNPACIDIDDRGFIVGHLLYYWVGDIPTIETALVEAIRLCDIMDASRDYDNLEDAIRSRAIMDYNINDYIIEDITEQMAVDDNTKHWKVIEKRQ